MSRFVLVKPEQHINLVKGNIKDCSYVQVPEGTMEYFWDTFKRGPWGVGVMLKSCLLSFLGPPLKMHHSQLQQG